MRPLWLDYRQPPPARRLPGLLLLVLGLAAGAAATRDFVDLRDAVAGAEQRLAVQQRAMERQRAQAREGAPAAAASPSSPPRPAGRSGAQWDRLFDALEAAVDETVTLLSLEPAEREAMLAGEAKNLAAVADFIARLAQGGVLAEPRLVDHEIVRGHPQRPVRFSLVARWSAAP